MFTKRQEAELITSLQWRWEIPLKFAYLWDGAKNRETIAQKRWKRWINLYEKSLLTKRVQDFLKSFNNKEKINIFDLWCGDWFPIMPILDELREQNISFRYVPLDISQEMLDLAESNVKSKYNCEVKKVLFDFELGNFSDITYSFKSWWYSNLLCFLWSTIWNFSDRNRVLTNMRDSMGNDDFLLIWVEMTNFAKINKIIPHYEWELVEKFLYYIPWIIGIKREESKYKVVWNDKENQIEIRISINNDQKLLVNKESFMIEKDEQILISRSVKFNEWTLTKLLSDTGFRTEVMTTTTDRWYVLSMVQPTRYSI